MIDWLAGGALALAALGFSARYTWWRLPQQGVPVLMYHHIGDPPPGTRLAKLWVPARSFARQLDWLSAQGYRTLTLSQALARRGGDQRVVVLTFDDGYADFYTTAWPLLQRRGMTATVFLVTGELDGLNRWDQDKEPEAPLLTRRQVQELAAAGVEFGGHSHRHRDLTTLEAGQLKREVVGCQKALTDLLGRPARSFSYPYGHWDARVAEEVRRAGFDAACTTRPGKLTAQGDPLAVPRIIVKRSDDALDFRLKLSRARSRL
jgi:peptidoglycan/xylan/chitin deacetylase (PgdA/CDA1 family)